MSGDEALSVDLVNWVRSEGGDLTGYTLCCEFGAFDGDPTVRRAIELGVQAGQLLEVAPDVYRAAGR